MKIEFKSGIEHLDWEEISNSFKSIGWGKRTPEELRGAFSQSSVVISAYAENELVGFGRSVDDGHYYALVVDLIVLPDYQGKGIGSKLLSKIEEALGSFLFTTLTAAPGKEGFYKRQGWSKQKAAFIFPRSDKQRENFGESF